MNRIELHQIAIEILESIEKAKRQISDYRKSRRFFFEIWLPDMMRFYEKKIKSRERVIQRLEARYQNHLKKIGV